MTRQSSFCYLFKLFALLSILSNYQSVQANLWGLTPGSTAVVTGGTKGIGKAIVDELAEKGARILTCSRNPEELQKCVESWKANGFDVTGIAADVASPEGREDLMNEIRSWLGEEQRLDVLVNNVGTNIRKASIDYTLEDVEKVFNTNFHSMFALTTACHPLLKRKQGENSSSVINIGSVAGGKWYLKRGNCCESSGR